MRVAFIITAFIILPRLTTELSAQNFIGMHKDAIIEVMKETQNSLKLNTSAINPHYNYLKYEDKINEITLLFFLSDNDECTLVRKMCDYSNLNDEIKKLNKTFTKEARNKWYYTEGEKKYSVSLTEEDWFFTVTTKLVEED